MKGLQHWTAYPPPHAAPATPEDHPDRFRSPCLDASAFPFCPQGQHLLLQFDEATSGFTFVTACGFAIGKLTTPDYSDAASLYYQGVRTFPRTGL